MLSIGSEAMLTSETETDIKNWYANTIHENLSMKKQYYCRI